MTTATTAAILQDFLSGPPEESSRLHHHFLTGGRYSDGVKFLADTGEAWWLVDAIFFASKGGNLQVACEGFEVWTLERMEDGRGVLTCTDGGLDDQKPKVVYHSILEFTDFPLTSIKFYLEDGVLMLPKER